MAKIEKGSLQDNLNTLINFQQIVSVEKIPEAIANQEILLARKQREMGAELISKGLYEEAVTTLERAKNNNPLDPITVGLLSISYFMNDKTTEALKTYDKFKKLISSYETIPGYLSFAAHVTRTIGLSKELEEYEKRLQLMGKEREYKGKGTWWEIVGGLLLLPLLVGIIFAVMVPLMETDFPPDTSKTKLAVIGFLFGFFGMLIVIVIIGVLGQIRKAGKK